MTLTWNSSDLDRWQDKVVSFAAGKTMQSFNSQHEGGNFVFENKLLVLTVGLLLQAGKSENYNREGRKNGIHDYSFNYDRKPHLQLMGEKHIWFWMGVFSSHSNWWGKSTSGLGWEFFHLIGISRFRSAYFFCDDILISCNIFLITL